jgi:arabinogalactan oligomer/maltooligosaccharide transport system substrate-binding protein
MLWAAAEFQKTNPNVTITYEPVGAVDARAKIELDGPAGVGADVFVAPHDHIGALVNGGHVLKNPVDLTADFVPAAVTGATYKGVVYGYPLAIESIALFYNKDLVKTPPKTWDDVIAFSKTFTNKAQNKFGIAWAVADPYVDYFFMAGFGAPLFGPNGDDRNQHNIDSPQAIAGVKYFQSLRKLLLDVPSADVTGDFVNSSFVEGKTAMILTGPWKIKDFTKANVNFGIVPMPAFPGKTTPPTTFSGIRLAFVSAYTNHPAEAQAFAKFLISKPVLMKRLEMTSQIPPRKDITITDPLMNAILEQAKYATPMPSIPQMGTYWASMGAAFGSIWDGGSVEKELGSAAAAMKAAK